MSEFIKFETLDMRKRELFDFICRTLEDNGWINIASNPSSEGVIYQSKGEDGKQDILINIFDGYDLNVAYKFSTTAYQYLDMRCLISYEPSTTLGTNGVSVPPRHADSFNRVRFNIRYDSMGTDSRIRVRYHCNKNRIIVLVTMEFTTLFFMLGKSDRTLSKEYANTGNTLLTTYSYKNRPFISYGVADRNPTGIQGNDAVFINPLRSIYNNNITLSEIGFGNALEGIKGYLDGVYHMSLNTYHVKSTAMTEDIIIDELGNEFTILYMADTDSSSYPTPFPACNLAVCTKKAGE